VAPDTSIPRVELICLSVPPAYSSVGANSIFDFHATNCYHIFMNSPIIARHIPALDGLRGLAVISVVFVHVNGSFGGPFPLGTLNTILTRLFGAGWVGVDLFFVLSGFLITGILYDSKNSPHYLRNFYMRRSLRIVPLYYGFLLALMVFAKLSHGAKGVNFSGRESLSLLFYYYNFHSAFSHSVGCVHHFWSLAVEEHFYLVWPFFVAVCPRGKLLWACVLGAVFSIMFRIYIVLFGDYLQTAYLITPCRLDGLLSGAFIAICYRDSYTLDLLRRWATTVFFVSGGALLALFIWQRHFYDGFDNRGNGIPGLDSSLSLTLGITCLSSFFSSGLALLVDLPTGSLVRSLMEWSLLRSLGRYSYGIYVFHPFILGPVFSKVFKFAPSITKWPDLVAKPLFAALVLLCSYLVAMASYHLYVEPV